ncbi:MAG: 16S rRNA (guanine(527)-N(7))-methyltransferase RsmG [Lentisphaeria bacterium]
MTSVPADLAIPAGLPDWPAWRAFALACGLPETAFPRLGVLEQFHRDLAEANAQHNLTRLTDAADFWIKHVADSLTAGLAAPGLHTAAWRVADVGCGAGFPLIPLAWANPALAITGIETNGKKTAFLEAETARLGLGNCHILARQAREAGRLPGHQQAYDLVVARAVAEPHLLLRECRALLNPTTGGRLILFSTPEALAKDAPLLQRETAKFGLVLTHSPPILLPGQAGARQFAILGLQK